MSLHIISQYYNDQNPLRNKENKYCLLKNLNHPLVSQVHCLIESDTILPIEFLENTKLIIASTGSKRLTFQKAIDYAESFKNGDIFIILNSDIYLDYESPWNEMFQDFSFNKGKIAMALTRHEVNEEGDIWKDQRIFQGGCQDAWIFQKLNDIILPQSMYERMDFCVGGCLGCDGYMNYLMKNFGMFEIHNHAQKYKILHFDRVRGHSNAECITNEKTDYSLSNKVYNDPFVMSTAFACPYINYNLYLNRNNFKYPLNYSSTCFKEHAHIHLDGKNITTDAFDQSSQDIIERLFAVGRKSITEKEKNTTWKFTSQYLIQNHQNVFVDLISIPSEVNIRNFPDGAFLYCQWAQKYKNEKNYEKAYQLLLGALEFNYNSYCSQKEAYDYTRHHLMGIVAFYVQDFVRGKKSCQIAFESKRLQVDEINLQFYQ